MNATNSNYNLHVAGIYIKNNETLYALFFDGSSRIILGEVDMAYYSFSFKQTLPEKSGSLKKAIFLDEYQYMYGIGGSEIFNTFFTTPTNFTSFSY